MICTIILYNIGTIIYIVVRAYIIGFVSDNRKSVFEIILSCDPSVQSMGYNCNRENDNIETQAKV